MPLYNILEMKVKLVRMWEKTLHNSTAALQHDDVCSNQKERLKKFEYAPVILKGWYVLVLRTGLSVRYKIEISTVSYMCIGILSGLKIHLKVFISVLALFWWNYNT